MSDEKKEEKKEASKPLKEPESFVNVLPKNEKSPDQIKTVRKVQEKLKESVDKAIKENESGGKEKQFEAVEKEVKKAGEGTDSRQVEKIRVRVKGKDGDGDKTTHEWEVAPKEGKPKP